MPDRWLTKTIDVEGGIFENLNPISQGEEIPGSLLEGVNFEADASGGYRRISGYAKFDSSALDGTGKVKGVFIFDDGVIGIREQDMYFSTGSGWSSAINTSSLASAATKYRGHLYDWSIPTARKIIIVNSEDFPVRYDGTTFDHLTTTNFPNLTTDLQGATSVWSFKRHMFFTKGQILYFSAPGDETSTNPVDGGGAIQIGREVNALRDFRDALYIFGPDSIHKLTGNNSTDFSIQVVTEDLGLSAQDSIQEIGGDLIYLSEDGLRTIAGTERIGDIELGNLTRTIDGRISALDFESGNKDVSSVLLKKKNQYRIFSGDSTQVTAEARGILGSLRRQRDGNIRWEWYDTLGIDVAAAHSGKISNVETIVHGDFSGFVYTQETGSDFNTANISARLQFPFWPYTNEDGTINNDIRKTLYKMEVYMTSEGAVTPTMGMILDYLNTTRIQPDSFDGSTGTSGFVVYDGIDSIYDSVLYDTESDIITKFNLIGTCFNSSFFVESNDTNESYTIQLLTIQYGVGGRR